MRAKALILRSDLWTDGSKHDWRAKKAIQNTLDHSGIVLLNVLTVEQRMMNHAYDTTGSQPHRRLRHPLEDGRMVRQKNVAGRLF